MPSTITAPAVAIAPPRAGTLFAVAMSCAVVNSHSCFPSVEDTAKRRPSPEPWKTTPGIAVGAAPRAATPRPPTPGAVNTHAGLPSAAWTPPTRAPPPPYRAGGSLHRPNARGTHTVVHLPLIGGTAPHDSTAPASGKADRLP